MSVQRFIMVTIAEDLNMVVNIDGFYRALAWLLVFCSHYDLQMGSSKPLHLLRRQWPTRSLHIII